MGTHAYLSPLRLPFRHARVAILSIRLGASANFLPHFPDRLFLAHDIDGRSIEAGLNVRV